MGLSWIGSVCGEGGPLVVADVDAWSKWLGAVPFSKLRAMQGLPPDVLHRIPPQRVLHYWGQFSGELPAPFAWTEGHRFLECATEEEARAQLTALRSAVSAHFGGKLLDDPDGFGFVRADGRRLTAELAPTNAYDEAWQAAEDAAWEHPLGPLGAGLFWEMEGGGVAEVAVSTDGQQLVLARAWLSGDEETEAAELEAVHALVAAPAEEEPTGAHLAVASGQVVAAWSPVAPFQLANVQGSAALKAAIARDAVVSLDSKNARNVGVALTLAPGRYRASVGRHEAEGWSCHWCRLTLTERSDVPGPR